MTSDRCELDAAVLVAGAGGASRGVCLLNLNGFARLNKRQIVIDRSNMFADLGSTHLDCGKERAAKLHELGSMPSLPFLVLSPISERRHAALEAMMDDI